MSFDAHKNFAVSTVATAPSPASSGTSLTIASGDGALFPAAPFNATVWPASSQPTTANAEIVRVTAVSTDTFTIVRAQEGTSARTILAGDQIANTITAKTLTDIESRASGYVASASVTSAVTSSGTSYAAGTDLLGTALSFTADGSSDYLVTFGGCSWSNSGASGTHNRLAITVDGTDTALVADCATGGGIREPLTGLYKLTAPSAGTHTINLRLYVGGGAATVAAGNSGAGGVPGPLLVTVQQM